MRPMLAKSLRLGILLLGKKVSAKPGMLPRTEGPRIIPPNTWEKEADDS